MPQKNGGFQGPCLLFFGVIFKVKPKLECKIFKSNGVRLRACNLEK